MTSIQNTAYHEAGHVVVRHRLGLSLIEATIVPDPEDNALGSVRSPGLWGYDCQSKVEQNRLAQDMIIGMYAGLEAERIFDPNCDPALAEHDDAQAFDLLREIPPRNCRYIGDDAYFAKLERLRKEARRLVRHHWGDIVTIANALLDRRTLTGVEVGEILDA